MTAETRADSTLPAAVVGAGHAGFILIIRMLLVLVLRRPSTPVTLLVVDASPQGVAGDKKYPLSGGRTADDLHPFQKGDLAVEQDGSPVHGITFAEYIEFHAEKDPALREALIAPTWRHVGDYLAFLLETLIQAAGDSLRLEHIESPVRAYGEPDAQGVSTLTFADGSAIEVGAVFRPGPVPGMPASSAVPVTEPERHAVALERYRDHHIAKSALDTRFKPTGHMAALWHLAGDHLPYVEKGLLDEARQVPFVAYETRDDSPELTTSFADPQCKAPPISTIDCTFKRDVLIGLAAYSAKDRARVFRAMRALARAAAREGGHEYARDYMQRLHAERWLPGCWSGAVMMVTAAGGFGAALTARQRNPRWLRDRLEALTATLDHIKKSVSSLTEWSEALYCFSAEALEMRFHLGEGAQLANAAEWHEWIEGALDDITKVHHLNATTVLRRYRGIASQPTWISRYVTEARSNRSEAQYREHLTRLYEDRITMPRWFLELALESYGVEQHRIPIRLNSVDPYRAASIGILEILGDDWAEESDELLEDR